MRHFTRHATLQPASMRHLSRHATLQPAYVGPNATLESACDTSTRGAKVPKKSGPGTRTGGEMRGSATVWYPTSRPHFLRVPGRFICRVIRTNGKSLGSEAGPGATRGGSLKKIAFIHCRGSFPARPSQSASEPGQPAGRQRPIRAKKRPREAIDAGSGGQGCRLNCRMTPTQLSHARLDADSSVALTTPCRPKCRTPIRPNCRIAAGRAPDPAANSNSTQ